MVRPRPILNQIQKQNTVDFKTVESKQAGATDLLVKNRILRKKRSKEYMGLLSKLDMGQQMLSQEEVSRVITDLQKEFPEVVLSGILLGYVAKCYLGAPYEVHILDYSLEIIEHMKKGQPLPGEMEKARGLVWQRNYAFVEVYTDCCRAISQSGDVSVIPR